MKQNASGLYEVTEGEMSIKDTETGAKLFFYLDPETNLVIRSFLEEDIKPATKLPKITSKERREEIRNLRIYISRKNSENYAFIVEKIVGDNSDNPYEKDREIIGYGFRNNSGIKLGIYKREEETLHIRKMVEEVGKYYGLKGVPYSTSAK